MTTTTRRDITYTDMSPADVFWLFGAGSVPAMATAERHGSARCGAATIIHTGYQRDASEFNAATALYRVNVS